MATAPTIELADLILSPAPGLQFTRHGHGTRIRYVASDVQRGKHLSLRPDAYRLLGAFDGRRTIRQIYAAAAATVFPAPDAAARVVAGLHAAGLVRGELPDYRPPPSAAPIEAQLVSWRRELVELGPWLPLLDRLLGGLFTRPGAVAWGILLVAGGWLLADRSLDARDLAGWIAQIDPGEAFGLYLIFLVLKAVHELGHAVAFRRFAAAEGIAIGSVRAGVALMFLVPFPFTNVTGAWQLSGRWRRTMVGAAGMYVESWAALIALLVWGFSGDPVVRAAAGQVAAVSGITTVLFNLNPLGRMDGYYIFTDLLDRPNLARQASQAALAVLARATGALDARRTGSIEAPLLVYWFGAWLFRFTIYAALFWTALVGGTWAGVAVLLIAGSLLVARPLAGSLRWLLAVADDRGRIRRRLVGAGLIAAAILLVPLPSDVTLMGVVERDGMTLVYPPRAARLTASGSAQFATDEVELIRAEIAARQAAALIQWRQAIDDGRAEALGYGEDARSLGRQTAQLDTDLAVLRSPLTGRGVASLALDDYRGSTVAVGGRPVAVRLPSTAFAIHAVAHEAERKLLHVAQRGRARAIGATDMFPVTIASVAPSATDRLPSAALGRFGGGGVATVPGDRTGRQAAEPVIEVALKPIGHAPLLRQGERVEVRLDGGLRPLALQLYDGLALALGALARI